MVTLTTGGSTGNDFFSSAAVTPIGFDRGGLKSSGLLDLAFADLIGIGLSKSLRLIITSSSY